MAEKIIVDHAAHVKTLIAKTQGGKADAIKELVDYLVLQRASR